MAALDLAIKEKEEMLAREKALKQASRYRLVADKTISVASIHSVLSNYLRHKETNDLWSLVAPPATGPQTFGWHTYPSPEWLCKTASLLFDLVELAPNTKLQSTKLFKCLRSMYENKELHLDIKKGFTVNDSIDRLDLTIRVLLNMIRNLKCNDLQRLKTQRNLTRHDWLKLDLVLDRVQLPAELMAVSSLDSVEDEDGSTLRTVSVQNEGSASGAAECLALVPCPVKPEKKIQKGLAHGSLKPLPVVFQKHLDASSRAQEEQVATATAGSSKKQKLMEKVLQEATEYEARASNLSSCKSKAKKVQKKSNLGKKKRSQMSKKTKKTFKKNSEPKTKKEQLKKKKNTQEPKAQKEKSENSNAPDSFLVENSVYKPGEMLKQREIYVKSLVENSEMTRQEAMKSWQSSLSRAMLLKDLSTTELVKRRFVPAGCKSNPFAEIVAKHSKSQDVD